MERITVAVNINFHFTLSILSDGNLITLMQVLAAISPLLLA